MKDLELGSESLLGGQKGLPREGDPEADLDGWERVFQAENGMGDSLRSPGACGRRKEGGAGPEEVASGGNVEDRSEL